MTDLTLGHGKSITLASNPGAVSVTGVSLSGSTITGTVTKNNTKTFFGGRVEFVGLHADAVLPAPGSKLAAGLDLVTPEKISFAPGERKAIPLGFALAIPDNLHGRIESRSGLALKGLVVLTGVIDADYRGELKVIMQNFSDKAHEFAAGDRVAQLVLRPTVEVPFEVVDSFSSSSDRGAGGFGSTGR